MILDLREEHLEEAEILAERRAGALHSERFDLGTLAKLEARLDAHLDGLALGAEAWLAGVDPRDLGEHEAFTRAAALLRCGARGLRERVFEAVPRLAGPAAAGVARALGYVEPTRETLERLGDLLHRAEAAAQRVALDALSFQHALPDADLGRFARSPDSAVRVAAVRALGRVGATRGLGDFDGLLGDRMSDVRDAALESAARLGEPRTLDLVRAACADPRRRTPVTLRLLACLGERPDVERLAAAVGGPALAEDALAGLGTLGYAAAVAPLLEFMGVPALARGAGAAFARITGLAVRAGDPPPFGSEREEDEHFEDLRPLPDEAFARAGWDARARGFEPGTRYRRGHPIVAETWLARPHAGDLLTRREELTRLRHREPDRMTELELDAPAARQRRAHPEGEAP